MFSMANLLYLSTSFIFFITHIIHLSDIKNLYFDNQIMNPVAIGTIIWLIVGLIVGWKVMNYVA
jgi:hypothetical protein